MPIADAPTTTQRLLALLSLLQTRRDWPGSELAGRLGVSERTVRRDVDRLRELDYAIAATRGRDGGYRLGAGAQLPPLLLDDEQAVAIAIALRGAAAMGAGIEESADRALGTLSRTMPPHLARRIESIALTASAPSGGSGDAASPDALLRIGEAIARHEELRFDYRSPGAEADAATEDGVRPPRTTEPHHLLLRGGRWYVVGYSRERDDWRIHRVDRMSLRSHTGRRFAPREVPGGDAERYLAARFRGSVDDRWPCRGEATLALPIRDVAPFVGDGTAEAVDDAHTRVRLGAWSWPALAAAIGRFDAEVADVAPVELAAAFGVLAARFAVAGARTDASAGSEG